MTFNLRRDVAADGPHAWTHRNAALGDLVLREAPHVLGTQEGLAHQLGDLDKRLPHHARVGRDRNGDGSDEACAIYYDTRRFELVASGDLWLSDTPDEPGSATWGNRHPRLVTWAALRDRASGAITTFANTHLDHESAHARQRAARFLAARLRGAVLMGDLNATPGEPPHAILLDAGWSDAGADSSETTFHGFTGQAWARIDYVLVPPTMRARSHRVPVQEGSRYASDHHPVVAEIEPLEKP
jgi:endonuclease/exonuclease/phosphatase family metal-dependent hydrolase